MANKQTKDVCGPPKVKDLPAEVVEQVSIDGFSANVLSQVLKASLPELAKQVGKGNSYVNSVAGAVKGMNIVTSLDMKVNDINESWDGYHGFRQTLSDAGLLREWRSQRPGTDYTESVSTTELFEDTQVDIHIVFTKKLKDKKFLAAKGVK